MAASAHLGDRADPPDEERRMNRRQILIVVAGIAT